MSGLLKLNWRDILDGIITAVAVAIVSFIYNTLQNGGNILTLDWNSILNVAILAFIGYIVKALGTAENGKLGGII